MKIGFISDAHGHLGAYKKGFNLLRRYGAEQAYFLGDAVGYLPSRALFAVLAADAIGCIRGNHDEMHLQHADCRPEEAAQIESWPTERIVDVGADTMQIVHGSPRVPLTEYVYAETPLEGVMPFVKANTVVMGHTHRPFVRAHGGVTFVNVGSCGLPRDDARFGSVALLDVTGPEPWRILRFNIELETKNLLANQRIAPLMREFFETRRAQTIMGDIVE